MISRVNIKIESIIDNLDESGLADGESEKNITTVDGITCGNACVTTQTVGQKETMLLGPLQAAQILFAQSSMHLVISFSEKNSGIKGPESKVS